MKFNFKLSEDAPGQHVAILGVAGIFIFLSLVESFKQDKGPSLDTLKGSYSQTGETIYNNPQMSWWERALCRGYQRSGFCSYKTLHPFREVWEQNGIKVAERAPIKTSPVRYRGPIQGNRSLSGKTTLNEFGE